MSEESNFNTYCYYIHFISLFIKVLVSSYGYSGENNPPKFGDFEAQRHWMEITYNLEVNKWYKESELNPSTYWPIDYPPMSAYFAWLWGNVFKFLIPQSVAFYSSRGYEEPNFRRLMRFSVLITDLICFHLPLQYFFKTFYTYNKKKPTKYDKIKIYIGLILSLFSPCLVLIDNGHFQYNCVMLGSFIMAASFVLKKKFYYAIIFMAISINFKQMGVYYLIPFGIYTIAFSFKNNKWYISIFKVLTYIVFTAICFLIIWYPFIYTNTYQDVIKRIFPLWRGIFEDKVATFWCTFNVFKKLNNFSENNLLIASIVLTTIFSLPSIGLFSKKSRRILCLSFLICSMSFYLFSFHVHEKTIMVPFLAFCLCYEDMIVMMPSFVLFSSFSLQTLLEREDQILPYFALTILLFIFTKFVSFQFYKINMLICNENKQNYVPGECILPPICSFFDVLNLIIILFFNYYKLFNEPPKNLPYLYPAINAAYSFVWFCLIYFASFIRLISITSFDDCN